MADPIHERRKDADTPESGSVRSQFTRLLDRLQLLPDATRARLQGQLTETLLSHTIAIDTPRGRVSFVALGRAGGGRGTNLMTKQPSTIAWIDGFRPDGVLWDVGANVGVYTLYAALRGDTTVVAFEPAAVNYFLLAANCEANGVDARVQCLLAGLGREKGVASLEVSQFAAGQSFSFQGKANRPFAGRQAAFIMTMDQMVEEYRLPCPNYIKIDVPGLTADVLAGGARTLRRAEVRELHMEIDDRHGDGAALVRMVQDCGLVLAQKDGEGLANVTFVRPDARE